MTQFVPATTAVKRSRAHNVDTDRLLRRRTFLHGWVKHGHRQLDVTRADFGARAAELTVIENVLVDRGAIAVHDRLTCTPGA